MDANYLIPTAHIWRHVSGAVEKNIFYVVDCICSFVFQDRSYKEREELIVLYHMYLDMLIENEDEEGDMISLEDLKTSEFYEVTWQLYNAMYNYLAPILKNAEWYIYTVNHMQIVAGNLFLQLDVDGQVDEASPCSPANILPLHLSI